LVMEIDEEIFLTLVWFALIGSRTNDLRRCYSILQPSQLENHTLYSTFTCTVFQLQDSSREIMNNLEMLLPKHASGIIDYVIYYCIN
jgi:hypothetical protein